MTGEDAMRCLGITALLCGIVGTASVANAATYQFETDKTAYDVSSGPVAVRVYLAEIGSGGAIEADGGLAGAAFRVARQDSGRGAKIIDLLFNGAFDDTQGRSRSVADGIGTLSEYVNSTTAVTFDPGTTRVYLGSIQLGKDLTSETTTFQVGTYGVGSGYITTVYNTSVDTNGITPASFTVSVPEPACLGLVVIAGMLARRRVRRA